MYHKINCNENIYIFNKTVAIATVFCVVNLFVGHLFQRPVTPQQPPPLRRGRQAQTKCSASRGRVCSMRFLPAPASCRVTLALCDPAARAGLITKQTQKDPFGYHPQKTCVFCGTRGGELRRPSGATTTPRRFRRTPSVTTRKKHKFFVGGN